MAGLAICWLAATEPYGLTSFAVVCLLATGVIALQRKSGTIPIAIAATSSVALLVS